MATWPTHHVRCAEILGDLENLAQLAAHLGDAPARKGRSDRQKRQFLDDVAFTLV